MPYEALSQFRWLPRPTNHRVRYVTRSSTLLGRCGEKESAGKLSKPKRSGTAFEIAVPQEMCSITKWADAGAS